MARSLTDLSAYAFKKYFKVYNGRGIYFDMINTANSCCTAAGVYEEDILMEFVYAAIRVDHIDCFKRLTENVKYSKLVLRDLAVESVRYNAYKIFIYLTKTHGSVTAGDSSRRDLGGDSIIADTEFLFELLGEMRDYDERSSPNFNKCYGIMRDMMTKEQKEFISRMLKDRLAEVIPDEHVSCLIYLVDDEYINDKNYNICNPSCSFIKTLNRMLMCSNTTKAQMFEMSKWLMEDIPPGYSSFIYSMNIDLVD